MNVSGEKRRGYRQVFVRIHNGACPLGVCTQLSCAKYANGKPRHLVLY
jgi:hypothetical protein